LGPVNLLERFLSATCPWLTLQKSFIKPRSISVLLVYLGFLLVIALSAVRWVPILNEQVRGFAQDLPHYLSQLEENTFRFSGQPPHQALLPSLPLQIIPPKGTDGDGKETEPTVFKPEAKEPSKAETVVTNANELLQQTTTTGSIATFLQKLASGALGNLLDLATTTLARLVFLLTGLVILFYFLLDGERLKAGFIELIPSHYRMKVSDFLESIHTMLYTFIKGQVVLGFMAGLYLYIVYSFLGVKYAGFLGFFFGTASILPVVGPWMGLLPGILVVLFGQNPTDLVALLMLTGGFYVVKEYWLIRKVVGNILEMHPVVVILAFLACLKVAGVSGVLLAFPVASILSVTFRYIEGKPSLPPAPEGFP
jgi:predicted PurR-regulated permease PerM